MTLSTSRTAGSLTIGDVSDRTGVSPATLRMWEIRHGFPKPQRRGSGHRRYSLADVETILDVLRRRNGGTRLDVAIDQAVRAAQAEAVPESPSVFAELRAKHANLATHRMRKRTLLALSWAIEDEFCARAERSYLFGGFQKQEYYEAAEARWHELARVSQAAYVFTAVEGDDPPEPSGLTVVPLPDDAPLRREWAVVCDAPKVAVALSAWELPGQGALPDHQRVFESTWTLDPVAVRDAARVCAQVAASAGAPSATPTLYALAEDPPLTTFDPAAATAMFNRVVAYVDRYAVR